MINVSYLFGPDINQNEIWVMNRMCGAFVRDGFWHWMVAISCMAAAVT
jgi:hypothetical protein